MDTNLIDETHCVRNRKRSASKVSGESFFKENEGSDNEVVLSW